jgi:hypothetical protein
MLVAAWIIGLLIASAPGIASPAESLIAYYQANSAMVQLQAYLANGLTGILLMVFGAGLHTALRRADGEASTLSTILLVAATVVATLSCMEALFMLVLARVAMYQDVAVIRTLLELNVALDAFKLPILGIMIAATSLLAGPVNKLPLWLTSFGAVEAVLLFVASANGHFPGDMLTIVLYVSGGGLLVWTAAVSVVMGWLSLARRQP